MQEYILSVLFKEPRNGTINVRIRKYTIVDGFIHFTVIPENTYTNTLKEPKDCSINLDSVDMYTLHEYTPNPEYYI